PILFSTAIIVLTFAPILSFEHVEGRLFRPLAIMMIFNLLGAVLATMTIIPVLCLYFFKRNPPSAKESPVVAFLERAYEPLLRLAIRRKAAVIVIAAATLVSALVLVPMLGSEFIPELEEGNIWLTVTVLPTSVTLDKSVAIAREIRQVLKSYPEVINVVSQVGAPDDGTDPFTYSCIQVLVDLKPPDKWRKLFPDKEALVASMNRALNARLPGLLYNFSQYIKDNMDEAISGVRDGEVAMKVYGPDLNVLEELGARIGHIVASVPGMADVGHDHLLGQPQIMVTIDWARAARYGIRSDAILDVVETSIGGKPITQVIEGEKRFNVILRFQQSYRDEPEELGNILVAAPSGQQIPLSQLATITEEHGATNIWRDANERRIAVHANIRGRDLGSAMLDAERRINQNIKLPAGYHIVYAGQFDRAIEAGKRLAVVVPVTLALIFFLLYAEFGQARLAALVMSTVPLAAAGGLVALFVTGTHLSISSGVGFIALFGLAIMNGVIIISKIRELEKEGIPQAKAIVEGCTVKMRPVLTAAIVALAGLIPAAMSTGIGAQSQRPFAIVIVGGLMPATVLTLLVLPALYDWLMRTRSAGKFPVSETPDCRTGSAAHLQGNQEQAAETRTPISQEKPRHEDSPQL
ncbi:MAG TPA: efflux RND transporter permease subunit, partial [Candidatus Obscuribacterales bacterium]